MGRGRGASLAVHSCLFRSRARAPPAPTCARAHAHAQTCLTVNFGDAAGPRAAAANHSGRTRATMKQAARMEHSRARPEHSAESLYRRSTGTGAPRCAGARSSRLALFGVLAVCYGKQTAASPPTHTTPHPHAATSIIHTLGHCNAAARTTPGIVRGVITISARPPYPSTRPLRIQIGAILGASCRKGADSELEEGSLASAGRCRLDASGKPS
jgi:hypothetical protein